MKATEVKVERGLDVRIKGRRKEEVFMIPFFCLGITRNVSFCFYEGWTKR